MGARIIVRMIPIRIPARERFRVCIPELTALPRNRKKNRTRIAAAVRNIVIPQVN
jgi:hypothetical protein